MEMVKVLVAEKISEKGMAVLKASGAQVDLKLKLSREELMDSIQAYDAIIVRSATKVDEELFEKGVNLKVVGRAGNGVDNIDMSAATRHGVIVVNTPDANSVSAAEHTIGLLLAASRKIPQANQAMKQGIWDRTPYTGVELYGKTIGIVGLGRIGALVATRLKAFDMHVMAYDPYIEDNRFEQYGVERKRTLESMIQEADFITVHTPKNRETMGMIGKREFALAKNGLCIVNCARGGIIDEKAIAWAVAEGIVAGGGVDVLVDEPETSSPLFGLEHIIQTPHLGADTVEAQERVGISIARDVIDALKGKSMIHAVNHAALLELGLTNKISA